MDIRKPKGVYRMRIMGYKDNDKGVTLIELVVVIAIMTTLTGLLVPQFMKYVSEKRQEACTENREAIVNVCEKMIYTSAGKPTGVNLSNLSTVVNDIVANNPVTGIPEEYQETLRSHWECPDHGTMTVTVVDGVIKCECSSSDHADKEVVADMITWSGSEAEMVDPNFGIPAYTPIPETPPTPEETPSGSTPSGHSSLVNTYWPYPNHADWQDPSKVVGGVGSSNPALLISVPSGKFPMRNANGTYAYYVAIDKNSTGTLKIDNMYAASPQLYLNGPNNEGVIACNGTEYTAESIVAAANSYPSLKETDDNSSHGINEWRFLISGGTIYDNGVNRYIYFHQGQEYANLPTVQNVANNGEGTGGINKYGNWYLMKRTDEVQ